MGLEETARMMAQRQKTQKLTETNIAVILALAGNGMNVSHAAKALYFCHSNVLYHIKKVKGKTGLDPRDFYDLCALVKMVGVKRNDTL